ncbi:MAG: peptide ABC transporter ATP-binding protein, partial [Propionibacteriaceae bacterium]|nr:peptide ABC transporter ATP-binding protein [Propionibacteriaceae bacterium]
QRVAIARAISTSPTLILADEPVSSLDVAVRSTIVHLLRKLKDEDNLTLVLVSHDIPLLTHICDRIIRLDELNN